MKAFSALFFASTLVSAWAFPQVAPTSSWAPRHDISLQLGFFGGSSRLSTVPTSPANRDRQAIEAVKAAIAKPKTPSFPLLECEFPPLQALNKMSDGSLRSANQVDDANLAFCAKLVKGLAPLPMMGPKVWFLTSTTSGSNFMSKANKVIKGAISVSSLRDGIPEGIGQADVCIVVSPSSRQDYMFARQMASDEVATVIINALAKDQKSVSCDATMAFFLKPLTYNSQVVGYLARQYPNDWATIDIFSKQVLGSYTDDEILFQKTSAPDLRGPGRLVQKSVDERAIKARKN